MSFRKRNVGLSGLGVLPASSEKPSGSTNAVPGVRPSPVDGRPTTSTGTPSLDGILAGHAGLALGTSLLLEESGTTDYAGTLLRYYAAEGIMQGHSVHVVGVGQQWGRDLPGVIGAADDGGHVREKKKERERMKIAWRYERLGEFGAAPGAGGEVSRGAWTSGALRCVPRAMREQKMLLIQNAFNHPTSTNQTQLPPQPSIVVLVQCLRQVQYPHLNHQQLSVTRLTWPNGLNYLPGSPSTTYPLRHLTTTLRRSPRFSKRSQRI